MITRRAALLRTILTPFVAAMPWGKFRPPVSEAEWHRPADPDDSGEDWVIKDWEPVAVSLLACDHEDGRIVDVDSENFCAVAQIRRDVPVSGRRSIRSAPRRRDGRPVNAFHVPVLLGCDPFRHVGIAAIPSDFGVDTQNVEIRFQPTAWPHVEPILSVVKQSVSLSYIVHEFETNDQSA